MPANKRLSIAILIVAEMLGMSLWFTTAAVLPDMVREAAISTAQQAFLSSAVQAGFVVGALLIAVSGIADRMDPRHLFALSAIGAALANGILLIASIGGSLAITARFVSGCLLAGVYPVGMKIAVGWTTRDRGLLVGSLIGALTLGKSAPFLWALLGGTDWRLTVAATSGTAALAGLLVLGAGLGPYHARSPSLDPSAIRLAWTNWRIRRAYIGYLGHMWELFAMWAWVGVAAATSFEISMDRGQAVSLAKLTAFLSISLGAVACVLAGRFADLIGKAEVTIAAMTISGSAALLTAATYGNSPWLTFLLIVVWGIAVIPDSAQFSAIVADNAPPQHVGSLLTFQTALGFGLTIATVQLTPIAAQYFGWPLVLASLALGPFVGTIAMLPLRLHARAAKRTL
jgi:MFS family permease